MSKEGIVLDNENVVTSQPETEILDTENVSVEPVTETPEELPLTQDGETAEVAAESVEEETADAEPVDDVADSVEETEETAEAEDAAEEVVEDAPKAKSFAIWAWLAAILPMICAALPFATLISSKLDLIEGASLFGGAISALSNVCSLLGIRLLNPSFDVLANLEPLGFIYGGFLLVLPAVAILSIVLAVFSTIKKDKSALYAKMTAVVNFAYYFCLAALFTSITYYNGFFKLGNESIAALIKFDLASIVAAVAALAIALYLAVNTLKKKSASPLVNFVCSSLIAAFYLGGSVFFSTKATVAVMNGGELNMLCMLAILLFSAAVFFISLARLVCTKGKKLDVLISGLVSFGALGIIVGTFVFSDPLKASNFAYATLAAFALSLVQLFYNLKVLKAKDAPATEEVVEEEVAEEATEEVVEEEVAEETEEATEELVAEEVVEETITEEVVEEAAEEEKVAGPEDVYAVPEESDQAKPDNAQAPYSQQPIGFGSGYPQSGLTFASTYMKNKQKESMNFGAPITPAAATPVQPIIAYDWFLESLTAEEKQEFVTLFVYKNLGSTANLPDYVPGGDNYLFFRFFFLNLGKYRERISANLLNKMYKFMTNMY